MSNNLGGAGRIGVESSGLVGENAIAYQIGAKVGDAAAIVTGAAENVTAGGSEVLSLGGATPVAIPVAIHGTSTMVFGAINIFRPIKYVEDKTTKEGGKYTEPTLPSKTIADNGDVKAQHYTRGGDHGPPHVHIKGGGKEAKVGQNGKPVDGSTLTSTQQSFVDEFKSDIRSALKKIGRWYNYNRKK